MSSLKDIKINIESHRSLKGLVEVYEEMAANTMRQIRVAILSTRDYYSGLSSLSLEVSHDLEVIPTNTTTSTALVFLSAGESMYGDIIDKICLSFLPVVKQNPQADVFVIGQVGLNLMRALAPKVTITEIPPNADVSKYLYQYDQVSIFFGQFHSLARQEPISRQLSTNKLTSSPPTLDQNELQLKYLYEPTIKKIALTFAQEIFSSLFEQSSQENELAKNASRLIHLDQALNTIDHRLERDLSRYHSSHKRIFAKRQHTQIASYKAAQNLRRSLYV